MDYILGENFAVNNLIYNFESRGIDGFEFVWITDGKGWKSARKNLKDTFLVLDTLYNISDLEDGIFRELFDE